VSKKKQPAKKESKIVKRKKEDLEEEDDSLIKKKLKAKKESKSSKDEDLEDDGSTVAKKKPHTKKQSKGAKRKNKALEEDVVPVDKTKAVAEKEQEDAMATRALRSGKKKKLKEEEEEPVSKPAKVEEEEGGIGARVGKRSKEKEEVGPENEGKQEEGDEGEASPGDFLFRISQLGGGTGSKSGDVAIIMPGKSRRIHLVDFGILGQRTSARELVNTKQKRDPTSDESEYETDTDYDVLAGLKNKVGSTITHGHADHEGEARDWNKSGYINIGTSYPDGIKRKQKRELVPGNSLFAWRTKDRENAFSIHGIPVFSPEPEEKAKKGDDNAQSLGAIIKVMRKSKSKKGKGNPKEEEVFKFLTLGDMEPHANENVLNALKKHKKGKALDLIKLPHHGSSDNIKLLEGVEEYCDAGTKIVMSGFTKTAPSPAFLEIMAKFKGEKYVLFNEKSSLDDIGKTADVFTKSGFAFKKDMHVGIAGNGKVVYKVTDL
jgi:hypothetical protein